MSLGLIGAYNSDSDSGEDENAKDNVETKTFKNPFEVIEEDSSSDGGQNQGHDDEDTDGGKEKPAPALSNPFLSQGAPGATSWLPKPSFMQETEQISGLKYESSVFSNPFRAKEDRKEAILSKHVGVTVKQEAGTMFNGKKVCYNFRKGRCRHGHKCKFAHDNDVSKDVTDNLYTVKYDEAAQISSDKADTDTRPNISIVTHDSIDTDQDHGAASNAIISSGKKKRPGLSDNLTPSKKAMKFHNKVYN